MLSAAYVCARNRRSQPRGTSVSLFSSTTSLPSAAAMPRLAEATKPRFFLLISNVIALVSRASPARRATRARASGRRRRRCAQGAIRVGEDRVEATLGEREIAVDRDDDVDRDGGRPVPVVAGR